MSSSSISAAREADHMQGWQPGDPIHFASGPEREKGLSRVWSPGDLIRFWHVEEVAEANSGASISQAGSPTRKQARKSTPSPRRSSKCSIATQTTGPSSLRSNSPFDRSSASWVSHRFEPPSPSPSIDSTARGDFSFSSTARLSPSRHVVPQPANMPQSRQSPSTSRLLSPLTRSVRIASTLTNTPRGATQISQGEIDDLVNGVDFEEDLPSSSEAVPLVEGKRTLAPDELEVLVSGIDFSDGFEATGSDDSIEILSSSQTTTAHPPSVPMLPAAVPSTSSPPASHRLLSLTSRATLPRIPVARRSRIPLRSSHPVIDFTDSLPFSSPSSTRNFASTSKTTNNWDELFDDEDLRAVGGKPVSPAPTAPAAPKPPSTHRKPRMARAKAAAVDKENDPNAASAGSKRRPLSATALRNQLSVEKDAEARAKWARTFNFREWAPPDVKVIYSTDAAEVEQVLSTMTGPFGFDLEWNVYGSVKSRHAALVQVCDRKTVLLVHVARMWAFPPALKKFIEDETKIKLGVHIAGDATKLRKDFQHDPRGVVDLNTVSLRHDPATISQRRLVSLQKLVGQYLDCYLPKDGDVRCSRWHELLSEQQLEYAANDVYSSLMVVQAIHSLANLSPEESNADLRSLLTSAAPRNLVPRQAPPVSQQAPRIGVDIVHTPPFEAADVTFTQRRLELFEYFSNSTLSFDQVHAKMNETGSMKPISIVWTLLSMYTELKAKRGGDSFDLARLRDFVLAVEDDWSPRFLAEHGALVSELRRVAPAQSKPSG